MIYVCKPAGRGNWNTVTVQVTGRNHDHADLFDPLKPGERIVFGDHTLRVCEVLVAPKESQPCPVSQEPAP